MFVSRNSSRLGGFSHGGPLPAQRGPAAQWADRGRPPDAQQRAAQPDGHGGRPGGLEPPGAGPRAGGRLRQVTPPTKKKEKEKNLPFFGCFFWSRWAFTLFCVSVCVCVCVGGRYTGVRLKGRRRSIFISRKGGDAPSTRSRRRAG